MNTVKLTLISLFLIASFVVTSCGVSSSQQDRTPLFDPEVFRLIDSNPDPSDPKDDKGGNQAKDISKEEALARYQDLLNQVDQLSEKLGPSIKCQYVKSLTREVMLTHYNYGPESYRITPYLSRKILQNFLATLDPHKIYFSQEQVKYLKQEYARRIGDNINRLDCSFISQIFNLYHFGWQEFLGMMETMARISDQQTKPFDLSSGQWLFSRLFGVSHSELNRHLYYLPSGKLARIKQYVKEYIDPQFHLLSDQSDHKTLAAMLHDWRMQDLLLTQKKNQKSSWYPYEVFMKSFFTTLDPHSQYITQDEGLRQAASIRLGVKLRKRSGYLLITDFIKNSTAAKSSLEVGDRIMGLLCDEALSHIDYCGEREEILLTQTPADQFISFLTGRGAKTLRIQRATNRERTKFKEFIITLKPNDKDLYHQVSSRVYDSPEGRVGVIHIPEFYAFTHYDSESGHSKRVTAFDDTKRALNELKENSVDSVLIDLRGNAGGMLKVAIQI
ncbi:MAG: S41 family peptidase, partial [Proteobacteria bacterium]|nr:S41 family peptidase [Pseudomonadota bacterium]